MFRHRWNVAAVRLEEEAGLGWYPGVSMSLQSASKTGLPVIPARRSSGRFSASMSSTTSAGGSADEGRSSFFVSFMKSAVRSSGPLSLAVETASILIAPSVKGGEKSGQVAE